ncbi:MAG: hypothetical protein GF421_12610 [Candidatus Aminicenantes bacterium]|nr:hypothetical protein [Candidatus Aminicenantes bacterium]
MKRTLSSLVMAAFILTLFPMAALCQGTDITGTWVGKTYVPDQGEDGLTLEIEKEEGEYTVFISDDFGMVPGVEADDASYEDGTLSFNFSIFDGYEDMTVWITLEVEGDQMTGYWETADGSRDSIEMKRK